MVRYTFKLNQKKSYSPGLARNNENNKYGGIYLIYTVYREYCITIRNKLFVLYRIKLGNKLFLRPYKKNWDKHRYRLPYVYWGKKTAPLTRLWVVLGNNTILSDNKIVPEVSLIHQTVKLFKYEFVSKQITDNLFARTFKFSINNIKSKKSCLKVRT